MRMACAVALLVALAATPAVAMKAEVQTSPGTSYPIRLTSLKEARFRNTIR